MGLGESLQNHHHYMMVESFESKTALHKGKKISSIALYIPPNSLTTTLSANYEGLAGGATKALTGSRLGGSFIQNIGDTLAASFTGMADISGKLISKAPIGKVMMAAGAGMAVNNHMALVYRGPGEVRTHSFNFSFFPKDPPEAEMVNKIINDFKNGMSPTLVSVLGNDAPRLTAPYFKSPRQYEITFLSAGKKEPNRHLFQIKKSVIQSMTINHDPQGVVGFHNDGAPVQATIQLQFKELEHVISADSPSEEAQKFAAAVSAADQATEVAIAKAANEEAIQANIATGTGGPSGGASDYRLKDNISLLQEEGFGIPNIYSFNYKWDTKTTWIGVMAQELLDTGYSDAVGIDSEGFYNVDYSKLGFPMIGVRQ